MIKPLTIVNVEDKDSNLALISEFLAKDIRFKLIAQVHTGKDALRICSELQPDIIVIDSNVSDIEHKHLVEEMHKICPESYIISISDNFLAYRLANAGSRYIATEKIGLVGCLHLVENRNYARVAAKDFIAMQRHLTVVLCHNDTGVFYGGYPYLVKILANYPYFKLLTEAHSGKDALIICPAMKPDFIIVDCNIPDMNLVELVTQLMELCPTSAIITTSMSDSADYMQKMMLAGVRYFMTNPFDEEIVHTTLINIDRHRRHSLE